MTKGIVAQQTCPARRLLAVALTSILAACASEPATPETSADRSRTLTVVINFAEGGGADQIGRMVTEHLTRHMPGVDRVKVENVAGAGGIRGTNEFSLSKVRDGSMVGFFRTALTAELLGAPGLRTSHLDFPVVGAIGQQAITYVRRDTAGAPLLSRDRLRMRAPIKVAGYPAPADPRLRLALDLLQVPYQPAYYRSDRDIRTAFERNEVQLAETSEVLYRFRVLPYLVDNDIAVELWQVGIPEPGGGFRRSATLKGDIPTFLEFYQARQGPGAVPSGPRWEWFVRFSRALQLRYALFLPPGTPPDVVAKLRNSWRQLLGSSEFRSAYRRKTGIEPVAMIGAEAERVLEQVLRAGPSELGFIREYARF